MRINRSGMNLAIIFGPVNILFDPSNTIIYRQFGEGNYEAEDRAVRSALLKAGWNPPDYGPPAKFLVPRAAKVTPELYGGIGFLRQSFGNKQQPELNKTVTFTLPDKSQEDMIYLEGPLAGRKDYVESVTKGSILLNYLAQAPYIVLASHTNEIHEVEVLLDANWFSPLQGKDIIVKNGKTIMLIDQPRLYYPLTDLAPYERHIITLRVEPGVRLYSFTFGVY